MKKLLVLLDVPALLAGCASTVDNGPNYEPKANFSDFKDITWLPETSVRAPYNARELTVNALDALRKGVHVFYDTHDTRFSLTGTSDILTVTESAVAQNEGALSWGAGSDTLYRNGVAVKNQGGAPAKVLEDGRYNLGTPAARNS